MIFDAWRKKWLVLTPEEWVRQHLVNYLVNEKKYPAALISLEKQLQLNDLIKRYDVVVFSRERLPFMVVECKAPFVAIDQQVVDQALRYNIKVNAPFVMLTNGVSDRIYNSRNESVELPAFPL
jgi:hypothetical protein